MSGNVSEAAKHIFHILGVGEKDLVKVMPKTIEEAKDLGQNIQRANWFKPQKVEIGCIFCITHALIELREEEAPEWTIIGAMIDAMPKRYPRKSNGNREAAKIYNAIAYNMRAIRNGEEKSGCKGLKVW